MSAYLNQLIDRLFEQTPVVQPRLPALYEPDPATAWAARLADALPAEKANPDGDSSPAYAAGETRGGINQSASLTSPSGPDLNWEGWVGAAEGKERSPRSPTGGPNGERPSFQVEQTQTKGQIPAYSARERPVTTRISDEDDKVERELGGQAEEGVIRHSYRLEGDEAVPEINLAQTRQARPMPEIKATVQQAAGEPIDQERRSQKGILRNSPTEEAPGRPRKIQPASIRTVQAPASGVSPDKADLQTSPVVAPAVEPATVVQVSIGRIEVRAAGPTQKPAPRPAPVRHGPAISLEAYLKRRNGGPR